MPSLEYLVANYGYWALFVGTFLEGETVLVLAGLAAHAGYLDLEWVMVVAFAGSFLGDQFWFFLGRWKGKPFLDRRKLWQPRIARANALLDRHATWILLIFRFLYGLRSVIPFVVGASRIRIRRFMALNAVGAVVWAVAVALLGYFFGAVMREILHRVKHFELTILIVLAMVALLVWLVRLVNARRRLPPTSGPLPPPPDRPA